MRGGDPPQRPRFPAMPVFNAPQASSTPQAPNPGQYQASTGFQPNLDQRPASARPAMPQFQQPQLGNTGFQAPMPQHASAPNFQQFQPRSSVPAPQFTSTGTTLPGPPSNPGFPQFQVGPSTPSSPYSPAPAPQFYAKQTDPVYQNGAPYQPPSQLSTSMSAMSLTTPPAVPTYQTQAQQDVGYRPGYTNGTGGHLPATPQPTYFPAPSAATTYQPSPSAPAPSTMGTAGFSQYNQAPQGFGPPSGSIQNGILGNQGRYGPAGGQMADPHGAHAQGARLVNLLQSRRILPTEGVEVPAPEAKHGFNVNVNCSPDIFRCTLNVIPNNPALLQKSRLPLAILIHPYRDLSNLQVLSCNTIVRCRSCRSYINPFVTFIDQYKWRCNMCDRSNDLPQEFFHDPVTNTVGDPSRRPEVRTATIEYIAPGEYALRPPQPAIYVFLLDVCFNAIEVRYLDAFRERLLACLDRLPGDARTQVAFIAYDSAVHFFQLDNSDWKMLTVADIEDVFVPSTEGILNLLHENMASIRDLITRLPEIFKGQRDTHSAMGAAVQIAHKILAPTGGRITILQTYLPTLGPGALKAREDPNLRAAKEVKFLEPATDFYKTLALECSSNQVAVDLFLLAGQYADLTTISGIARYSGGCIHYYPAFNSVSNPVQLSRFESDFTRYLTRKIGFESVMRVRCTNGMSMTAFHGNFFVRSVDLLSLPNINPDSGFAVQIKMDEALPHPGSVCFQAALLYTSSRGERRIRVHTLSVPVSDSLSQVFAAADQEAIAAIVGKMAAERAFSQPLGDVRDGIVFACEDALRAYTAIARPSAGQLLTPFSLRLLPLFTHSLLNCVGLRSGVSTTLDQRTHSLLQLKAAPLVEEMMTIYPRLYAVHNVKYAPQSEDGVPRFDLLQLSYENIERGGVYLLEGAVHFIMYVTEAVNEEFLREVLGVERFQEIADRGAELPELPGEASVKMRAFMAARYAARPLHPVLEITKETGKDKLVFLQHLYDDRSDSMTQSYYEFLTDLMRKVKAV